MSVYQGPPIECGSVLLVEPNGARLRTLIDAAELAADEKGWFERAQAQGDLLYFSVDVRDETVGQIVLHDLDRERKETMVAYHIFRPKQRGQGYGTAALDACCRYVFGTLGLRRIVMITSLDNAASRRIAEKCGFKEIGPAREGPHLIACERVP